MENKEKTYLTIIIILLFIIGIGIGYFIGTSKNGTKEEQRQERKYIDNYKKEKSIKGNKNRKKVERKEPEIQAGSLKSEGEKAGVDIKLNGKTNELAVFDGNEKQQKSYLTFGKTNLDKLVRYGTGPNKAEGILEMPEIIYSVINGKDNKEYLVVYYNMDFQHILLVLNDETEIIGTYGSNVAFKNYDCFATFNQVDESIFNIHNNEITYYKYPDSSKENEVTDFSDSSIELELTKLEISNDEVKEITLGTKKAGKFVQCT